MTQGFRDETILCRCTGVTCGEVKKVYQSGMPLNEVIYRTGAGAFCKQCIGKVESYLQSLEEAYEVRTLDLAAMKAVYDEHMPHDFDPRELKPWAVLERLHKQGKLFSKGFFRDETMVAYALFCTIDQQVVLLDYFAVVKEYRGQGIGGLFLRRLAPALSCDGIVLEVESGKTAQSEEEREICRKRQAFYRQNGVIFTPYECELYGVNLDVAYLPIAAPLDAQCAAEALHRIYQDVYRSDYNTKVFLYERS